MNQSSDVALDQIRETRKKISAQYEHNAAMLIAHYIELQEKHRLQNLKNNEDASNEGIEVLEQAVKTDVIDASR